MNLEHRYFFKWLVILGGLKCNSPSHATSAIKVDMMNSHARSVLVMKKRDLFVTGATFVCLQRAYCYTFHLRSAAHHSHFVCTSSHVQWCQDLDGYIILRLLFKSFTKRIRLIVPYVHFLLSLWISIIPMTIPFMLPDVFIEN